MKEETWVDVSDWGSTSSYKAYILQTNFEGFNYALAMKENGSFVLVAKGEYDIFESMMTWGISTPSLGDDY